MAKYMFQARYSAEGVKGLVRDGATGRRAAVEKACVAAGGKLESMYYAFGGIDAYVIADLPNNTSAAALALAVNQAGGASAGKCRTAPDRLTSDRGSFTLLYQMTVGQLTIQCP